MVGNRTDAPLARSGTAVRRGPRQAALRRLFRAELVLLLVQFLIGMVVNLYVQIPTQHPGGGAGEYFGGVVQGLAWAIGRGAPALSLHVALGLLILAVGLVLLGLAVAARRRGPLIAAAVGLLGVLVAAFNGASFINYGHDLSSLIMATGFLLALIAYAVGLERVR